MRALVFGMAFALLAQASEDMVTIPAGSFTMGRTKLTSDDKTTMRPQVLLDDIPARTVKMPAFQMDRHEVTNSLYAEFVRATKRTPPRHWVGGSFPSETAKHPVYNVSWSDAKDMCAWQGKRLPTEAEWERAARGGLEAQDYPNGDQITKSDARFDNSGGPGPVGQFRPNGFGLYDMAGGMAEWTADWFEHEYYKRGVNENPPGPAMGQYKVIRGGAWSDPAKRVTVFFRNWVRPEQKSPNIGVRCAK
jgi:formylglycine-generating enzyme